MIRIPPQKMEHTFPKDTPHPLRAGQVKRNYLLQIALTGFRQASARGRNEPGNRDIVVAFLTSDENVSPCHAFEVAELSPDFSHHWGIENMPAVRITEFHL